MFSKIWTRNFTHDSSAQVEQLRKALDDADTVILGAGAGLSTAAGFVYGGERFQRYFTILRPSKAFMKANKKPPGIRSTEGLLCIQNYSSAKIASPMPVQPTQVQPSLMLSAVRMPLSSTLLTAFSMASASSVRPKE